jgi:hypothetical protein
LLRDKASASAFSAGGAVSIVRSATQAATADLPQPCPAKQRAVATGSLIQSGIEDAGAVCPMAEPNSAPDVTINNAVWTAHRPAVRPQPSMFGKTKRKTMRMCMSTPI